MENRILISAVSPQKKKKDRYNIYVDGEYTASLGAEACAVFGIKTGAEVDADVLAKATLQDNTRYAFDSAISMLAHKMRTQLEISTRLADRGITDEAITAAMKKLIGYGYVDDAAYAEEYVDTAIAAANYGRRVIAYKLKEKGIDDALIETALAVYTYETEKKIAGKHVEKLRAKYANDKTARRKMFAALARRGFDFDMINTLLSGDEDI